MKDSSITMRWRNGLKNSFKRKKAKTGGYAVLPDGN
jgi:hypothetical protein